MELYKTLSELLRTNQEKDNYVIELSPARLITTQIYDHSLPVPFYNEYLSQIAQMTIWDKVYSGHQHIYYLNDLILTVNPDGKQSCMIHKLITNKYHIHPDLIKIKDECPVTEVLNTINTISTADNIQEDIDETTENKISLKCNLRTRVYRQISVSPNKFPPITKYHFRERRVYRTYSNNDVLIHFEILRPMECPKTFEQLLIARADSKYMIKIWIKNAHNLDKYLSVFSEGVEFISG